MLGIEATVGILGSYYGCAGLLEYSESDTEIGFQAPTPIKDPQTGIFRSQATIFNELAISHRLSMWAGRRKYGFPDDFTFAIKSILATVQSINPVEYYDVSLRLEVMSERHSVVTTLKSILITRYGGESRTIITTFNILPPSLVNFVRRARKFSDFLDIGIGRDESYLSPVADNNFKYFPSEGDRLSDGKRVDHVPALILIDIALFANRMANPGATHSDVSAEFLNYADPRLPFDIFLKQDHSSVEFVQNGQLVATVHDRTLSA